MIITPQPYAGSYKPPDALASQTVDVESTSGALKTGMLVAVYLEGWTDKTKVGKPSLGIVTAVRELDFDINYYKGNWSTEWAPWKTAADKIWHDTLPTSSVVLFGFKLESNKLTFQQKKKIRQAYKERKEEAG